MISVGLYVIYEGYLREVVSELEDSFIIEIDHKFQLVPREKCRVYRLEDLSTAD